MQIDEMCKDIAPRRRVKFDRGIGIHPCDKRCDCQRRALQGGQYFGFTVFSVLTQKVDAAFWGVNRGAVSRIQAARALGLQLVEGCHIGADVAIRGGYDRRGPAHDMIPAEDNIAPSETHVVSKMPWRPDRTDGFSINHDCLAILKRPVWHERSVNALSAIAQTASSEVAHDNGASGPTVAEGAYFCTRHLGEAS